MPIKPRILPPRLAFLEDVRRAIKSRKKTERDNLLALRHEDVFSILHEFIRLHSEISKPQLRQEAIDIDVKEHLKNFETELTHEEKKIIKHLTSEEVVDIMLHYRKDYTRPNISESLMPHLPKPPVHPLSDRIKAALTWFFITKK